MTTYKNETLTGTVDLDDTSFIDCRFDGTVLRYSGGTAPAFNDCAFDQVSFDFAGPAAQTINFLRSMAPAQSGMRHVVEGLIPELRD